MSTGPQLREDGAQAVIAADVAPHRMVGELIRAAILELADSGRRFTADDVRSMLPADAVPHSANLLPAHFGAQASAGHIEAVGMCKASRTSRRYSRNLIWQGVRP